jgi:hypothetical protein
MGIFGAYGSSLRIFAPFCKGVEEEDLSCGLIQI